MQALKAARGPQNSLLERIRRLPGDLERSLYMKRLAELTGLDVELLKSKVRGGVVQPLRNAGLQSNLTRYEKLLIRDRTNREIPATLDVDG